MSVESAEGAPPVILVAVDASPGSLIACEQAVSLAFRLGGKVRGLFVEDSDLLNWVASGIGREVSLLRLTTERPDREALLSQLVAQAGRAREALAAAAATASVEWSFEVARGPVSRTVGEYASDAHTLVLGRVGRARSRGARVGSTARGLARAPSRRVLLASSDPNGSRHIRVLLPPARESEARLMAVASEFAEAMDAPIEVVDAAGAGSPLGSLSKSRGPVIIAGDDPRLDQALLDAIDAPVLLVGPDELDSMAESRP